MALLSPIPSLAVVWGRRPDVLLRQHSGNVGVLFALCILQRQGPYPGLVWCSVVGSRSGDRSLLNKVRCAGPRNRSNGLGGCRTWLACQSLATLLGGIKLTALLAGFVVYYLGRLGLMRMLAWIEPSTLPGCGCSNLRSSFDANHRYPSIGIFPGISRPGQEG